MIFAPGQQPAPFPIAQGPALPPALARLGIQLPVLPPGWRGTMVVRINQDAPITIPLGEQATVGLPPMGAALPAMGRPAPAAAGGFGVGAGGLGMRAGGLGAGGLGDLLRQLIGQGRIARVPAFAGGGGPARPAAPRPAANPFGGFGNPFGGARMGAPGGGEPADEKTEVKKLLDLVNAERRKNGAGPLTLDPALNTAAHDHSADMAKRGFFAHDTPEGKKFYQRAAEAGTFAGAENIAGGQRTAEGALAAWLNSPGHRRNLMNPAFTRMGAGFQDGRWTQMFG